MNIVQGDTYKTLQISLLKGGIPLALLPGDVIVLRWCVGIPQDSSTVIEVTPTVEDALAGKLSYAFQDGETDELGTHYGQITLIRAGKHLSFPDDGSYFRWQVRRRI